MKKHQVDRIRVATVRVAFVLPIMNSLSAKSCQHLIDCFVGSCGLPCPINYMALFHGEMIFAWKVVQNEQLNREGGLGGQQDPSETGKKPPPSMLMQRVCSHICLHMGWH